MMLFIVPKITETTQTERTLITTVPLEPLFGDISEKALAYNPANIKDCFDLDDL